MNLHIFLLLLLLTCSRLNECIVFNQVIIWGHKLHSHTHSYIHNAFFRAFKHLGYATYWFDSLNYPRDFDFSHSLFITEGQVDGAIPLRDDCYYVLHNCSQSKYRDLIQKRQVVFLQVYTDDARIPNRESVEVEPFILYSAKDKVIYMPWATDLLPFEIDQMKKKIKSTKRQQSIYWVGTLTDASEFGNSYQVNKFLIGCKENKIEFVQKTKLSVEDNIRYIQESYMAPALVGTWQKRVGYIPCRIFKNISYGQWGITNSRHVYDLFNHKIVYNDDEYQLFYDARNKIEESCIDELFELMDVVKDKHTYVNRIQHLLNFFDVI